MTYDFKNVKVLVVETSPPLFDLMKGVLRFFTVPDDHIYPAFSVDDAFAKFRTDHHDLVLVDWLQNPDRGLQFTRRLRKDSSSPNPFVPVLMTAGSGHQNRVMRARDAGVSDYLVKPFTARTLALKIENIVEHPRAFVLCDTYVGPDRRRRNEKFMGEDRRLEAPLPPMPVAFRKDATGEEDKKKK